MSMHEYEVEMTVDGLGEYPDHNEFFFKTDKGDEYAFLQINKILDSFDHGEFEAVKRDGEPITGEFCDFDYVPDETPIEVDVQYSDYDEDHAEEWMEMHPHGYYNDENDYGTGDAEEYTMNKMNENAKVTLTIGQLKRLVKETRDRDVYDEIVRCIRKVKQEYGERGVAKFLADAFGEQEVKDALTI